MPPLPDARVRMTRFMQRRFAYAPGELPESRRAPKGFS